MTTKPVSRTSQSDGRASRRLKKLKRLERLLAREHATPAELMAIVAHMQGDQEHVPSPVSVSQDMGNALHSNNGADGTSQHPGAGAAHKRGGRGHSLPEEEISKIRKMYFKDEKTARAIAEERMHSIDTVSKYLKNADGGSEKNHLRGHTLREKDIADIRKRRSEGASPQEIADETHHSILTVKKYLEDSTSPKENDALRDGGKVQTSKQSGLLRKPVSETAAHKSMPAPSARPESKQVTIEATSSKSKPVLHESLSDSVPQNSKHTNAAGAGGVAIVRSVPLPAAVTEAPVDDDERRRLKEKLNLNELPSLSSMVPTTLRSEAHMPAHLPMPALPAPLGYCEEEGYLDYTVHYRSADGLIEIRSSHVGAATETTFGVSEPYTIYGLYYQGDTVALATFKVFDKEHIVNRIPLAGVRTERLKIVLELCPEDMPCRDIFYMATQPLKIQAKQESTKPASAKPNNKESKPPASGTEYQDLPEWHDDDDQMFSQEYRSQEYHYHSDDYYDEVVE